MKKVLITRPKPQAGTFADNLRRAGFEPVFFPVIEIQPIKDNLALQRALLKLVCFDWLVFTSVNGVEVVVSTMRELGIASNPENLRIAAIGPKTADALKVLGMSPDFVPDEYVAEAILPGLGDLQGCWVLLPRAEIARKALPEAIVKAGGIAHEIAVYRTVPTAPDPQGIIALKTGVDVITFTSPSAVQIYRHGPLRRVKSILIAWKSYLCLHWTHHRTTG